MDVFEADTTVCWVCCAFCEKKQDVLKARAMVDGRFVCNNQSLPDVGCRGWLWKQDWPHKEWNEWTFAEHEREQWEKKMEALLIMKMANL